MAKFALVAPVPPPPAGPRGPQAASPKIGIYQQPIFGGGYILGIYGYTALFKLEKDGESK